MRLTTRFRVFAALVLSIAACNVPVQAQTDYFWNGANIAASPAAGGTGTWSTTNAWRTVTDTGTQGTWAAGTTTNNAILAGSAGTITLGTSGATNFTGNDITVNTSGYTITSTSSSRNLRMTETLTLASSVALTLDLNNTNGIWAFGDMNLGSGASLTLQGIATANNANRVNLTTASGTSSGGSITLAGTAAGTTGFVGTAAGVTLNTNILNNSSTSATSLGATSGNSLTYGGVVSGSANLQISAGQSGGAGIVTLNNINTYTGNTFLNAASNSVLRIGVGDALPSGTTVFFGASAGGGTADTGGSIDLNGLNLSVGALDNATVNARGVANNTTTLSTLTIGKTSGTNTFAGVIGTVSNTNLTTQSDNIALLKTGGSTQILSGANTYTGGTTINNGTLSLGASDVLANTGAVSVNGASAIFDIGTNSDTVGALSLLAGSITGSTGILTGSSYSLESGTVSAILGGSGALTKATSGLVTLSGANTYTGGTTINGGTLQLGSADNRMATTGNLTLGGGTFSTGATTGFNQALNQLNFGDSSAISYGSGVHNLTFATISDLSGATDVLTVNNWTGNQTGGTAGEFIVTGFGNDASAANTALAGFLSKVQFTGYQVGGGATFITSGANVQLVPVPEPTTMMAFGAAGLGLVGYVRRRRNG